jgi:hypothetical protein
VAELSLEVDGYFESMKLNSDALIPLEPDALIGHSPDRTCAERALQSCS